MLIGTHNSFTYLKPRTWFGKLIRWTAQCQEVSIYEQYEKYNVRAFDFRVRLNGDGKVCLAHGLVEYADSVNELDKALDYLNKKGDCYVRVSLETRNDYYRSKEQNEWFMSFCKKLEGEYEAIKFYGGSETGTSNYIYIFNTKYPTSDGYHASWATKSKLDDIFPKCYAKKHNKESYEKGSEKNIMYLDFVNIGVD